MGDKLKQFIDDNREAFDSENPKPELFQSVQQRLLRNSKKQNPRQRKVFRFVAVAASMIIVAVSLHFIFQKNANPAVQINESEDAGSIYDPAYAKQIDQYKQLIDEQQIQLKNAALDHPDLYRQFSDDINRLDSAYRELKTTMEENPNTEILLEAMIRNLQLQTELLNRQLSIVKEIKQKSKA